MQIGLLSGVPLPEYPFLAKDSIDRTALLRPLLDTSMKVVHAAIRSRMLATNVAPADAAWPKLMSALQRLCGPQPLGSALALTAIANAASDVVFHNSDVARRTTDAQLLASVRRVLDELRRLDFIALATTVD
ncbi:hypothetical protein BH09MYX1_BH09MYX1_08330 [soil metagenome]